MPRHVILKKSTNSDPEVNLKSKRIKPAHAYCYCKKKFYSNLSFENHSNSALSKMAIAIRSLYLVQN